MGIPESNIPDYYICLVIDSYSAEFNPRVVYANDSGIGSKIKNNISINTIVIWCGTKLIIKAFIVVIYSAA